MQISWTRWHCTNTNLEKEAAYMWCTALLQQQVNVLPINARNELIVVGELDIRKNEIFNFTERLF